MSILTIRETVEAHVSDVSIVETLTAALIEREDNMADLLRLAAAQFGMMPQIVAEVIASIGIGTPMTDEARTMIRAQFVALMEQIREQFNNGEN